MWETLTPGNLELEFSSVMLCWYGTEESAARDLFSWQQSWGCNVEKT